VYLWNAMKNGDVLTNSEHNSVLHVAICKRSGDAKVFSL